MRKVKQHMYISDPRHPNHKEFLRLCNSGPSGFKKPKKDKRRPQACNVLASNRPKHSYVLSEHIHRI